MKQVRRRSITQKFHKALAKGAPKWKRVNRDDVIETPENMRITLANRICPQGKTGCLFPRVKACQVVEQAMYFHRHSYPVPNIN